MDDKTETKPKAGAIIVPVTLFEQNCTIIWHEPTKKAVVIDPGGDVDKIQAAIKQTGVTVEKIWLTHGHIDHVGGAADLRDALGVKIEGPHIADKYLLDNVVSSGERFGMTDVRNFGPDRWLDEGDQVEIGDLTFDILHCPGHSPGSVVFFNKELRFAHVGDVLFNGSVWRTDLPGGSHATLISSIKEKLMPLGGDDGNETLALAGQAIFDLGRHDAVILAVDQPGFGQRLQLAAEHTRRNFGTPNGAAQQAISDFAIAERAVLQIPDDAQLVFAADHFLESGDRTAAGQR